MSLAHKVVNTCLRINDDDNVTIFFYPHNLTLAEEIAEECFKNGADVNLSLYTDKFYQAYLRHLSAESLRQPSVFCQGLSEYSTAQFWLGGVYDPSILRDIPSDKKAADGEGESKAHAPYAKKLRGLGVGLALVTKPRAKVYGLDYQRWLKMMTAASNVDYAKLHAVGKEIKEALKNVKTINISAPNGTDLTLQVKGRRWNISDGVVDETDIREGNLQDSVPAGNINAFPDADNANGRIVFNTSLPYSGLTVKRVEWRFKDGELVKFDTDTASSLVKEDWTEATGDKSKLAFFAVGFNPSAEAGFTANEMVSGAVTVGIGGNSIFGGSNVSGFGFQHTLTGATVKADGKTILKAGKLSSL